MYNAQSFTMGLNSPSPSLGRSDSNGGQMLLSQGSTDLQKAQQMFQQLRKQEIINAERRPSDPNISHSGVVMASIGSGTPENFQASAGLMRYHSAPGSFLATLQDDGNNVMPAVSVPRPDNGLSQILSNDSTLTSESNSGVMKHNDSSQSSKIQPEKHLENCHDFSRMAVHNSSHLNRSRSTVAEENFSKDSHLATILENGIGSAQNSFCSPQISMMCQEQGPRSGEQLVNNTYKQNPLLYNSLDSSGEMPGGLPPSAIKNSLVRHSSSPAGALSQVTSNSRLIPESGYPGVMTSTNMDMAALTPGNSSSCNMVAPNRLSHHMNFQRQSSSPAQLLTQLAIDMDIPEIVDKFSMHTGRSSAECLARCSSDSARLGNTGRSQGYISSLSSGSWEDGTMLSGNYEGMQNSGNLSGRKHGRDMDEKIITALQLPDKLKRDVGSHSVSALANHHFGLFNSTPAELVMEKLLEDSVPCRIRAKRGCATHPRSIAERVRRTRISDRMRKLQELVPNMDKQTNTADMLDEAVEYVKSLQKEVQDLSEKQCKCECASRKRANVNKT